MLPLLLCSQSPRRRDLLRALGIAFEIAPSEIDEAQREAEPALDYARRLALEKAAKGARPGTVALGADTVVAVGEEALGKPLDRADAARMIRKLSGIEHRVITAVAVAGLRAIAVTTLVKFAPLSEEQIRWLVDSGEGDDKAGAYAAQGLAGAFIERVEGSFTNVVGLPLAETLGLLAEAGVELPWA